MLLARPRFAFLDRLSTTLGPAQVCQALRRLSASSITYVSFADAVETVEQYDAVLEIDAGGGWSWRPVDPLPQPEGGRSA